MKEWPPISDGFNYTFELCRFIRSHYGNFFSIGVAGFPEGHINSPDKETDAKYDRSESLRTPTDYIK